MEKFISNYIKERDRLHARNMTSLRVSIMKYFNLIKAKIISDLNEKGIDHVVLNQDNYLLGGIEPYIRPFYSKIGLAFASQTYKSIADQLKQKKQTPSVEVGFYSQKWVDEMNNYAQKMSSTRIKNIDEFTRYEIKKILNNPDLYRGGERKMIPAIRKATGLSKVRSQRIARTETTNASEYGSYISAKSYSGTIKKKWLATHDGRTRDWHAISSLEEQIVDLDGYFEVDGEKMLHVGDPNASGKNVVNCRCTNLYVPVRQEITVNETFIQKPSINVEQMRSIQSLTTAIVEILNVNQ